jgi:hypothetical protein
LRSEEVVCAGAGLRISTLTAEKHVSRATPRRVCCRQFTVSYRAGRCTPALHVTGFPFQPDIVHSQKGAAGRSLPPNLHAVDLIFTCRNRALTGQVLHMVQERQGFKFKAGKTDVG